MATFGRSSRWNGSENLAATKNLAAIQKLEKPVVATKNPAVATKNPAVATKNPAVATKNPAVATKNPAAATKNPAAATKNPAAATKNPAAATKNPAAATKKPPASQKSTVGQFQRPPLREPNRAPAPKNGSENISATKNLAAIQKSDNPVAATKKPAASQKSTVGQLFQRSPLRQPNRAAASKVACKTDDVAALSQSLQKATISEKAKEKPAVADAYSASLLPSGVPDIDAEDSHEPQLCSEYAQDIFDYMASLEVRWPVQPTFLRLQPSVTPEMRSILVNWLMQVHSRFQLLPETLFLTVSLVDRFLQVQSVSRSKLQLVGVSALFTASKYEEMMAPTLGDVVYVTDGAYQGREVLRMEQQILRVLDWSLGRPLPLHFLRRNSKAAQVDVLEHNIAKYTLELSLLDYSMSWVRPSEQAAAALCLALNLLGKENRWGSLMTHYGRYSEQDLQPTMQRMAALLLDAPRSTHKAPYEKYKSKRLQSVSTVMPSHDTELLKMAGRT